MTAQCSYVSIVTTGANREFVSLSVSESVSEHLGSMKLI